MQKSLRPMGEIFAYGCGIWMCKGRQLPEQPIEIERAHGDGTRHKPNGLYVGGHLAENAKSKITYRPRRSGAPAPAVCAPGRMSPSREPPRLYNPLYPMGRGAGKAAEGHGNGLPSNPPVIYARSG